MAKSEKKIDLNLGNLDEVSMWNRSLTPTEMLNLTNGGVGVAYTNWGCGEGSPPASDPGDNTYSSLDNNATNFSFFWTAYS